MNYSQIDTPLGPMLAIADKSALYLLEFVDSRGLGRKIDRLPPKSSSEMTPPVQSIQQELSRYFDGKLQTFKTPLFLPGTPFQKQVWEKLQKIPAGETRSYSDIAALIGKPSACRAVAQANASNQFAIVIPCHRVISHDGSIGGYAGGLTRKKWLLCHEKHTLFA